jgi:hypothetical protein
MSLTLEQIEREMLDGIPVPSRIGELRVILSAKFAQATNEYERVLAEKPVLWNEKRNDFKSDTACERWWEGTEGGVAERHWKFQIKKIQTMMSALKTLWEIKNSEAQNII